MGISEFPSIVVLPDRKKPYPSLIDFLVVRFPRISRDIWQRRLAGNKVHDDSGNIITETTPYLPGLRIHYYREVDDEPVIPFRETVLYSDERLLVACKPHFLPVTPSGNYVNECLLNRLKTRTDNRDLTPLNRIDMDTAGIVLFSLDRSTRGAYHELFSSGSIEKTYEAVSHCPRIPSSPEWIIQNRMGCGEPWFRMKIESGPPNTETRVQLIKHRNKRAYFMLHPVTGKKHQLRLHLSDQGYPIINDRFYPDLLPKTDTGFDHPLQLLSKRIRFKDPISGKLQDFESDRTLSESW